MRGSRLCVALGVLASAGCGKKNPTFEEMQAKERQELAPILERHRAASTKKFESLRAVAKEAAAAPQVLEPEPLTRAISLPANDMDFDDKGHLLLVNIEELAGPRGTAPALRLHGIGRVSIQGLEDALAYGTKAERELHPTRSRRPGRRRGAAIRRVRAGPQVRQAEA